MAIIKRGILGGFSKKIGSVVGSSWKGIAVMRSLPLSVANPRTAGQVKQRTNFKAVSQFASSILTTWIKPLWDRSAQQMSGYNAFIQANIHEVAPNGIIKPMDMTFSHGRLGRTDFTVTPDEIQNKVSFTWNPAPAGAFQMESDFAYAMCVDVLTGLVGISPAEAVRNDGTVDVDIVGEVSGAGIVAVLAFLREDGTISSDAVKRVLGD